MNILRACFCCGHKRPKDHPKTVFELRLDQAHKAYQALNTVLDIVEDERQLRKIRHAQKLTREVHYDLFGRHKQAAASPHHSWFDSPPGTPGSSVGSDRSFASAQAPLRRSHSHG